MEEGDEAPPPHAHDSSKVARTETGISPICSDGRLLLWLFTVQNQAGTPDFQGLISTLPPDGSRTFRG
jgi:hypothetical protein